jgi:hypothetical protein
MQNSGSKNHMGISMEKYHQEVTDLKRKLIYSLMWSGAFIILGAANLFVFDIIVGPKLIALVILVPKEMNEIQGEVTQVSLSTRNIKQPIYIVVETPQGTFWTQDKLFPRQFKENLRGKARLGEGELGKGETFKIFAIATKEDLKIGVLGRIPPDSIYSNIVNVRRVR